MNTLACLLSVAIVSCVTATHHGGWDSKNEKVGLGGKHTLQTSVYGSSGFEQNSGHGYNSGAYGHHDSGLGHRNDRYGQKEVSAHLGSGSGQNYGGYGHHDSGLAQFGSGSGHKYSGLGQYQQSGFGKLGGFIVEPKKDVHHSGYLHAGHHQ